MHSRGLLPALQSAIVAVFRHSDLQGYRVLSRRDRIRVNIQAGTRLLKSIVALHMLAALTVWLLAGHLLAWRCDWPAPWVHALFPAALLWLLPWLAVARRREMRALLITYRPFV